VYVAKQPLDPRACRQHGAAQSCKHPLCRAQSEPRRHRDARAHRGPLRKADAYTERTQKGAKTYYRARFAGFDRDQAEAACKRLKREDVACMALKI